MLNWSCGRRWGGNSNGQYWSIGRWQKGKVGKCDFMNICINFDSEFCPVHSFPATDFLYANMVGRNPNSEVWLVFTLLYTWCRWIYQSVKLKTCTNVLKTCTKAETNLFSNDNRSTHIQRLTRCFQPLVTPIWTVYYNNKGSPGFSATITMQMFNRSKQTIEITPSFLHNSVSQFIFHQ
jgi:hypothetical protein